MFPTVHYSHSRLLESHSELYVDFFSYGHKIEHRKFRTNTRKNFFTVRVMEHWNRLPRQVVESPSLEIFKAHLDAYLGSLL